MRASLFLEQLFIGHSWQTVLTPLFYEDPPKLPIPPFRNFVQPLFPLSRCPLSHSLPLTFLMSCFCD